MRKLLSVACGLLLFSAVGCGKDAPPIIIQVDAGTPLQGTEFKPVGTLQGVIVDAFDQAPIPGAKVTINFEGSSETVTTDATGTFAFVDVPASANPNGAQGATGTYSVVLDMTGQTLEGRTYKPYRYQTINVQFTEFTDTVVGGVGQTNQQGSIGVHHLVSNVTFRAHQTRAVIAGVVYQAPDLAPVQRFNLLLLLTGGADATIPVGAVAGVATSGDDGTYTFSEIEEGLTYRIAPADLYYTFDTDGNNYNPNGADASFRAAEQGVTTGIPDIVILPRPTSDNRAPYVVTADPADDGVLQPADVSKDVVLTFSEPMITQRAGQREIASFQRVGRVSLQDDAALTLDIPFTASWNTTADVLTIAHAALQPGFRYRMTVTNGSLTDLAGNARTGLIPFTSPAQRDALAITGGNDTLDFAVVAGGGVVTVTGLTQEPDTAENAAPGTLIRAFGLEAADPTDQSYMTRMNAGFYTSSTTEQAYVYWTAPALPVAGYYVYLRTSASAQPVRVGPGNGIAFPLEPTQTAVNLSLGTIDSVLANHPLGVPGIGLGNTTWNDALVFDMGVSALNLDGTEGPTAWVTVKDNTGPIYAQNNALGLSNKWFDASQRFFDSSILQDNANCASAGTGTRVVCPQLALPFYNGMTATGFGERIMLFHLSEPVDATTVTAANLALTSGSLPNVLGLADPNGTEPDGTILDAECANAANGRCTQIAVKFGRFFGIDTGDRLVLKSGASAGVRDVAGNLPDDGSATKAGLVNAIFVDQVAPMIKSVDADPATDTVTLVLSKFVVVEPPVLNDPNDLGNIKKSLFGFSNANGNLRIIRADHSVTAGGEPQVVLTVNDVSYLRGYNYGATPATGSTLLAQCTEDPGFGVPGNNCGSRVGLNNIKNADFSDRSGAAHTTGGDSGWLAYVNLIRDVVDLNHSPGAYMPDATGIGTRKSFVDEVGPRLSNELGQRLLQPVLNTTGPVAANGTGLLFPTLYITEPTPAWNGLNPSTSPSACNAASWQVTVYDLGADDWGTANANAPATNVNVTITSLDLASPCGTSTTLRISITDTSNTVRRFGLGAITMRDSVVDLATAPAGYPVASFPNHTSTHATWTYDPTLANASGVATGGWVRN